MSFEPPQKKNAQNELINHQENKEDRLLGIAHD